MVRFALGAVGRDGCAFCRGRDEPALDRRDYAFLCSSKRYCLLGCGVGDSLVEECW